MNSPNDQVGDDSNKDNRITQLETKLAFLEHTVEVLAGELEAQQSGTRKLHTTLDRLHRQLESLQHDTGITETLDEPPPHY